MAENEPKWILQSKTAWGLILMAVPLVVRMTGISWGEGDTASLQNFFDTAVTLAGMALGLWGRFTAKGKVSVLP